MTSERAREREVHKYYQTWLESSAGYRTDKEVVTEVQNRFHADGTTFKSSKDKALTAFAQLACLKLNVKRSIVTLISTEQQYVLAEATPSLSLVSEGTKDGARDELWFGNASIPRSQGLSEHALTPEKYTSQDFEGSSYTAPALVINNLVEDTRYNDRGWAARGVAFYCGVPIVSKAGFVIGVYTVTDDKPRNGLSADELRFMTDMAIIVMDHFETSSGGAARRRGEKMVLGLGAFVQGKTTIRNEAGSDAGLQLTPESSKSEPAVPNDEQQNMTEQFKGVTISDANPKLLGNSDLSQTSAGLVERAQPVKRSRATNPANSNQNLTVTIDGTGNRSLEQEEPTRASVTLDQKDPSESLDPKTPGLTQQIFSRAANILRECVAADGVVFYDAVSSNFAKASGSTNFDSIQRQFEENRSGSSSGDDASQGTRGYDSMSSRSTSADSGLSEDGQPLHILSSKGKRSRILGYSLDISTQSTASARTIHTLGLTEQNLRRFVRKYPQGKVFHFSADGEASSSDDPDRPSKPRGRPSGARPNAGILQSSSRSIGDELIQVVPGARNVVWLPLWDFSKQRWCAGAFMWSRNPRQLLTAQDDLAYLRTFGNSMMIELSRLDALAADVAKTTFIANISHELRSPLHGVLGSIEFLQDTTLDPFQSSMAEAMRTCSNTLLDTVEHLLDYTKINQLSKKKSWKPQSAKLAGEHASGRAESGGLDRDFDMAGICEEVVEAVFAGHSFNQARQQNGGLATSTNGGATRRHSAELIRQNIQRESVKFKSTLRLALEIEKAQSWWIHSQPGAIRRILMNILGNALKYTEKGTIKVSLTQTESHVLEKSGKSLVCLTVADTGTGMSIDFLQNHAFRAFTQESQFSAGTGLGLSIVRQIVNSLGGKIEVESQQGVGTTIKIWLTLPRAAESHVDEEDTNLLEQTKEKIAGWKMCILDPKLPTNPADDKQWQNRSRPEFVEQSIRHLAKNWFDLRVMRAKSMDGITANFFVYAEPPPIDYLLQHHGVHAQNSEVPLIIMSTNAQESSSLAANGLHQLTDLGRIIEVISQPCGPRKLAKTLRRCIARLQQLADDPQAQQSDKPVDDAINENSISDVGKLPDALPTSAREVSPTRDRELNSNSKGTQTEQSGHEASSRTKRRDGSPRTKNSVNEHVDDVGSEADYSENNRSDSDIRRAKRAARPKMSRRSTRDSTKSKDGTEVRRPASCDRASIPDAPQRSPVLLVDDNNINLSLLITLMKRAGRPYIAVKDGLQAKQAYEYAATGAITQLGTSSFTMSTPTPTRPVSHVLMDIGMPVMDGITSTRHIRTFERKNDVKPEAIVIALTGLGDDKTQRDMMSAGADHYIPKPIKFKELMNILDEKGPAPGEK